jgi:hypothetical protein
MELNPCLECTRKNQNKNNPICRDCYKRVDYVNRLELNLNNTASYGDDQPSAHRISLVSGGLNLMSLCGDVIY